MIEFQGRPEQKKEPHYISARLLDALSGIKESTVAGDLVARGAYLWGVEDSKKGEGIFNHVMLVSRVASILAEELQKKDPVQYGALDMRTVVETAILHDVSKLFGQDREFLSEEHKAVIGLRKDFREVDNEAENEGVRWLKEFGFSEEVQKSVKDHFPEKVVHNPYWKIVLVADYITGQHVMPLSERLQDVRQRWVDQPIAEGKQPRITSEEFNRSRRIIETVAQEIFHALGLTDEEFITQHRLNDPDTAGRWERFLRSTRERGQEKRATSLTRRFIGNPPY